MKKSIFYLFLLLTVLLNECSSDTFSIASKLYYDFVGVEQGYTYVHYYAMDEDYAIVNFVEKEYEFELPTINNPINTENSKVWFEFLNVHWNILVVKKMNIVNKKVIKLKLWQSYTI